MVQVLSVLQSPKNSYKWLALKIVGRQQKVAQQHLAISVCQKHCFAHLISLASLAKATYAAMAMTYSYLTPDLWKDIPYVKTPFQEHSDHLANAQKKFTVGLGNKNNS